MNTLITLKALEGMEKELRSIFSQVDPTELMQVNYDYEDNGVIRKSVADEYYSNVVIDNLSAQSVIFYMEELSKRNLLSERLVKTSNDSKSNLLYLVRRLDKDLLAVYFKEVEKQPRLDKLRVKDGGEFSSLSWALIFRGVELSSKEVKGLCDCLYNGLIKVNALIFKEDPRFSKTIWQHDEQSTMIAKMNGDMMDGVCDLLSNLLDSNNEFKKLTESSLAFIDFVLSKKAIHPSNCFLSFFYARDMLKGERYDAIVQSKTSAKFSFESDDFRFFRENLINESIEKNLSVFELSDLHKLIYKVKNKIEQSEKEINARMFIKLALVSVANGLSSEDEYKEFIKELLDNFKDHHIILGDVLNEIFNDKFLCKKETINNINKLSEKKLEKLICFLIKEMTVYPYRGNDLSTNIQENKKAYISRVPIESLKKYLEYSNQVNIELLNYSTVKSFKKIEEALKFNYKVFPSLVEKEWLLFSSEDIINKNVVSKKLKI